MKKITFFLISLFFFQANAQLNDFVTGLSNPVGLAKDGNTFYTGSIGTSIVQSIDASVNPPAVQDLISGISFPAKFLVIGTDLYLTYSLSNVGKIDLTASTPAITPVLTGIQQAFGLAVKDNFIYISSRSFGNSGILRFDYTSPNPSSTLETLVSAIDGTINDIAFNGNDLYFADSGNNVVSKIDVTIPNPPIINVVSAPFVLDVVFNGNILYYAETYLGRVDISNTTATPEILFSGVTSIWDMLIDGDDIYFTQQTDGKISTANISALTPLSPDYPALLDFFYATSGFGWTNNTNWLNDSVPLSDWYGITTAIIGGEERVTSIDLNSNTLNGSVPSNIGSLTFLENLNLEDNTISGNIPEELGDLINLNSLNIGMNNFEGNLPEGISNLGSLNTLIVSDNSITGNIPESYIALSNLQVLDVSNNEIACPIPDLTALPLQSLSIQNNRVAFCFENEFSTYQANISSFEYSPQTNLFFIANDNTTPLTCEINTCSPISDDLILIFPISGNNNTYQWLKNGVPIPGATSETLEIINFSIADNGFYSCVANNSIITDLTINSDNNLEVVAPASQSPDLNALIDFYNSTNGSNWTNNTNWLDQTKPLSSWYGVTAIDGRVTELNLNSNGLSGVIPQNIGDLSELTLFSIRSNSIFGSLPDSFASLLNLGYLDINSNFISSVAFPTWLTSLTNLYHLDIGFNSINGMIPNNIGILSDLQFLYLQNNSLSGPIPSSLTNLTNLQIFSAPNNNLSGIIPDLSLIPTLFFYDVSNNQFTFADLEPNFNSLNTNLGTNFVYTPQQFIDVNRGVSANIGETVTLETLPNLGSNLVVQWYDANTFEFLGSGESFDVTITTVDDYKVFLYFVQSSTVPGLGLQSRNITVGPDPSNHPDYNALVAVYNALDGPNWDNSWDITAPIETWDGNTSIDEIFFDETSNRVTRLILNGMDKLGNIPSEVGDLSELTYLSFNSENITGNIPSTIGNLTNLTELWLIGNSLSGEVPAEIWNLSNLVNLLIGLQSDTSLSLNNGIPSTISNFTNLEWLNLSGIQIGTTLPQELYNLPQLIRLRIQSCGLSGPIPEGLSTISDVIAGFNDFEGPIPASFQTTPANFRLTITNNLFDFSDLEPFVQSNNYEQLFYSPQRTTDEEQNIEEGIGSNITLTVTADDLNRSTENSAQNNQFQWFKDNSAINGANADSYQIIDAQVSDSGIYYCEITNPLVPDLTIVRAPITLAIEESLGTTPSESKEVKLYPNPITDWMTISSNNVNTTGTYKIIDSLGRLIHKAELSSSITLFNAEHLNAGLYFLTVEDGTYSQTLRFIKR